MKRPSGRFPRRKYTPKRLPKHVLRVLTEGTRTEPRYFFSWRERYARVRLELADSGMTPDALVRRAREYVKKQPLKHADRDFDEIWCVFDTDKHENLKEALVEAEQGNINVALSNPCFELWLVLHAKEQTAFINRDDVQRQSDAPSTNNAQFIGCRCRVARSARTARIRIDTGARALRCHVRA